MSFLALPEVVIKYISQFTNINSLLDSSTEFAAAKDELYKVRLNATQSLAYYHAHHRQSYVRTKTGKYYLSDAKCNDIAAQQAWHDHRRAKQPRQRICIENERQLAYYRKMRNVRLDLIYAAPRLAMLILSHVGQHVVALCVSIMMEEFLQHVPHLVSLSIMFNLDATDFRGLKSLIHLSIDCLTDQIRFGSLDTLKVYQSACVFQYLPDDVPIRRLEIWCSYLGGISELINRPIDHIHVHILDANALLHNEVGRFFLKSNKLHLFIYDDRRQRDTYAVHQLQSGYGMVPLI
jgi:hypothetical protein